MKILTVGYLHGCGGAERQIILLSNQLAQRGHDVTICILGENSSPYIISDNVHVVDLSRVEDQGRFKVMKRFISFSNTIERICPDVIINYNLQSAFFSLYVSSRKRGKVIYSERGDPYDKEYKGLLGFVRDYTIKHIDGLVFQSEGARDFFPERIREKSIVIHNSVNIPQNEYPVPSKREKRIVNVGRLHPQKNQKILIDAFSMIANKYKDYVLDIYGDGFLRDELECQIKQNGLFGRVRINASRKDIWKCIYQASLFVLTSDYEGMPNALMEAMALGLPCISTDCRPGGARTLISDGINGLIVPVRDTKILAEKMDYLLSNPVKAEIVALEARKIQETHSEEVIFNRWNNYIINL